MLCSKCGHEYEATNQHTTCPECGERVGTNVERDLDVLHARVVRWFEDWDIATTDSRKSSERDRNYYDGLQWTTEETKRLNERGQAAIVKNRIFKKINFLLGSEIRNRADPKALPRTPAHDDDVVAITDALRYVCDAQDFDRISSVTWEHMLIEGAGGAIVEHEIVGKEPAPGEQDERTVDVIIRDIPWDRIWWDIHSRKPDFSDANHKGISNWWDLSDAIDYYSDRNDAVENFQEALEQALTHGGNETGNTHGDKPTNVQWSQNDGGRKRIRVSECYYKEDGEWYLCHYTKSGFVVAPKPTGYVDEKGVNICGFTLASSFVTREGDRYGLVRHMIGPQDEINKRSSKALHWLSVDRVIAEDGAVLNPEEARAERAKPDGWVHLSRGALVDGRIQFEKGLDMAQGQISLLAEAKNDIDSIGPEVPNMANMPMGASGRALQMRQSIGNLELARLEDNHKRWKRSIYKQIWLRIKQFWPEEKWLRVRDDAERTGFRFVALNRKVTRGQRLQELLGKEVPIDSAVAAVMGWQGRQVLEQVQQMHAQQMRQAGPQGAQMPPEQHQQMVLQMILRHPAMQMPMTVGDVAEIDVDIILDESPDTSILQQEEYEQLTQQLPSFLQAKPEMAGQLLELILEASQLRNKKRLLEMMRKGADPKQVEMAEMMKQLQAQMAQAELAKTQSEAQLNQAKTHREMSQAQTEPVKVQAEAQRDSALAMAHAASAGEKAGGIPGGPIA